MPNRQLFVLADVEMRIWWYRERIMQERSRIMCVSAVLMLLAPVPRQRRPDAAPAPPLNLERDLCVRAGRRAHRGEWHEAPSIRRHQDLRAAPRCPSTHAPSAARRRYAYQRAHKDVKTTRTCPLPHCQLHDRSHRVPSVHDNGTLGFRLRGAGHLLSHRPYHALPLLQDVVVAFFGSE